MKEDDELNQSPNRITDDLLRYSSGRIIATSKAMERLRLSNISQIMIAFC